ncbi:MAG: GIY-YIG nuclease family protein [Candidatus Omnitrophota bacterium]|nr:MAG: GIY-YIG nuclease family protein [Candidatus Omnitrophota bacterium]
MKESNWYVYIIRCRDEKLYTGISNDVKKRVAEHNKGRGCRFTRCRYPVRLIYQEACGTKSIARKRELEIQGFTRDKKLNLVSKAR